MIAVENKDSLLKIFLDQVDAVSADKNLGFRITRKFVEDCEARSMMIHDLIRLAEHKGVLCSKHDVKSDNWVFYGDEALLDAALSEL